MGDVFLSHLFDGVGGVWGGKQAIERSGAEGVVCDLFIQAAEDAIRLFLESFVEPETMEDEEATWQFLRSDESKVPVLQEGSPSWQAAIREQAPAIIGLRKVAGDEDGNISVCGVLCCFHPQVS